MRIVKIGEVTQMKTFKWIFDSGNGLIGKKPGEFNSPRFSFFILIIYNNIKLGRWFYEYKFYDFRTK